MKIKKSTRHSKIAGDYFEHFVLYWLSKYGFECARVDHTGIDLIANNPKTKEKIGISVKGRTRIEGKEKGYVKISIGSIEKTKNACKAFGCKPYFSIVVDAQPISRCFILSLQHLLKVSPPTKSAVNWSMAPKKVDEYYNDRKIKIIEFENRVRSWW